MNTNQVTEALKEFEALISDVKGTEDRYIDTELWTDAEYRHFAKEEAAIMDAAEQLSALYFDIRKRLLQIK